MTIVFDLEHIEAAAASCWQYCKGASVLAFHGPMGAGKTTFIRALCRAKQVQDTISSPTFSIINEYIFSNEQGQPEKIFHLDLYRLKDLEEAIQAGVEDCLYQGAICLVEWPDIIEPVLPPDTVHLYLKMLPDGKRSLQTAH